MNGAITFAALGAATYPLDQSDPNFSPAGLSLQPVNSVVNDVTVIGDIEPQAYVHDYFVGDGLTKKFYLSQTPFTKYNTIIFDDEYAGTTLDPTLWNVVDPGGVVSVNGGKLQIAGGNGSDGATTVNFVEKIELGAAWILQHGDVVFNASSSGILGGLYLGTVSQTNCLAGFQVTPSGTASQIQALVSGAATGMAMTTVAGHHYLLTTRIYSQEIYRLQQVFHGAAYPAGSAAGGAQISANVRLVLEVHDVDPTNPASMVASSTVLYDDVIASAPASLHIFPGEFVGTAVFNRIHSNDPGPGHGSPQRAFRPELSHPPGRASRIGGRMRYLFRTEPGFLQSACAGAERID